MSSRNGAVYYLLFLHVFKYLHRSGREAAFFTIFARMKFSEGVKDGLPIGLGYFAVSFSFGIAGSNFLSWPLVTLISMTNLTSAGQFAGLQIMTDAAGTFIEMALATFFINLRYSLMAISLSQKVSPDFGTGKRLLLATGITDEIFAVAMSQKSVTPIYFLGLMTLPYIPFLRWLLRLYSVARLNLFLHSVAFP